MAGGKWFGGWAADGGSLGVTRRGPSAGADERTVRTLIGRLFFLCGGSGLSFVLALDVALEFV